MLSRATAVGGSAGIEVPPDQPVHDPCLASIDLLPRGVDVTCEVARLRVQAAHFPIKIAGLPPHGREIGLDDPEFPARSLS